MIVRLLALVIGLGFLLGASEVPARDAKPAGNQAADISGVWNSPWGPVTLQTSPGIDGKTLDVRGSYNSSTGPNRKGHIKSGTFDPSTGILEFSLEEPWWGNNTKGTAKLALAADGQKLEGPYLKTNQDGGRDEGTVTFAHVIDIAGIWESAWGLFTLRTAPTDGNKRSVTGFYFSTRDQTGLVKSGSFDPSTDILEFTFEAPWWGNDTKGTAKLKLAADRKKLEGPYLTTNKDGGRDVGVVTLTFGRDPAWKVADPAGLWESGWGLITLQTAPIRGSKLVSVSGSYQSTTGPNRKGLIRSGIFHPATGILELALDEPWWGNQTKGSALLTLDAAGNRFTGSYEKINQDGGTDAGVVSLLRLGGRHFAAALDSIFNDAGIKADTPGAAVMVIDHGEVIFSKCVGLARLTDKKPITRQTTFDLCSMGKQFTGAAILRLYEQGKLKLDDDIRKFIPEMPVYDARNPIRISHVARMTSGLPDGVMYADDVKSKNPGYLTNEDFAGEFARQRNKFPLKYPTGQRCEYSNTGYMVLGLVVERASKQSYSDFMKQEFFEPLGMKTAGVNAAPSYVPSNPAFSYVREGDVFRFGWGPASITHARLLPVGHGGICASLDDLERWDAGWQKGNIIKPATQKLALVPSTYGDNVPNNYAFGWGVTMAKGKLERMEHNGSFAGFLTFIERNVAQQRTLVVLCNSGSVDVGAINRVFDAMPPKRRQK